jgi:hypothetical protein
MSSSLEKADMKVTGLIARRVSIVFAEMADHLDKGNAPSDELMASAGMWALMAWTSIREGRRDR